MVNLPALWRDKLSETAYNAFINSIITMNTEYTLTVDDIKAELFHPKGIDFLVRVFSSLTYFV